MIENNIITTHEDVVANPSDIFKKLVETIIALK